DTEKNAQSSRRVLVALGEHHDRGDRTRAGEQRRRQRDERDVGRVRRRDLLAAQHLQGNEQEEQTTRNREALHRDVQVVEDEPAEERKDDYQPAGGRRRLERRAPARARAATGGQADEDRRAPERIHDDEERDEGLGERPPI